MTKRKYNTTNIIVTVLLTLSATLILLSYPDEIQKPYFDTALVKNKSIINKRVVYSNRLVKNVTIEYREIKYMLEVNDDLYAIISEGDTVIVKVRDYPIDIVGVNEAKTINKNRY